MTGAALIQALTTLVLGAVAAFIAWRQWRTSHDRLVLDLFERRFQVFQELTRTVSEAFHSKSNPDVSDLAKFDVATEKARFLFAVEVHTYLGETRSHLINLATKGRALAQMPDGPNRTRAENEMVAALDEMNAFYGRLAVMVAPYLQITTRNDSGAERPDFRRGLLRLWVCVSVLWVVYAGWRFWQGCDLISGEMACPTDLVGWGLPSYDLKLGVRDFEAWNVVRIVAEGLGALLAFWAVGWSLLWIAAGRSKKRPVR